MKLFNYYPLVITAILMLFYSCIHQQQKTPEQIYSQQEEGRQIFYDASQRAYGNIFLGMHKNAVDSLLEDVVIRNQNYQMITEYSNDKRLNSLYLKSNEVDEVHRQIVVNELASIFTPKYGNPLHTSISQETNLGLTDIGYVKGHKIHWGAYWKKDNKYIVLGAEDNYTTIVSTTDSITFTSEQKYLNSNIWIWIFNSSVWNQQGGAEAQREFLNL